VKVAVSGATGLIGSRLVQRCKARGDEITVLSRNPARAKQALGVEAVAWSIEDEPAPTAALSGRDGVVHLAGEPVAQRWSEGAKERIRESRTAGTRNMVAGLRDADPRPAVLICSSGAGYYGPRGDEPVDESTPPGEDFLARVSQAWEEAAAEAEQLGVRVVRLRTGVVLDKRGGALKKMLPPFKAGVGGPVAGGRHYMPWIHLDDMVGMIIAALEDPRWSGAVNASAPEPVTNTAFSKALGRALRRPAVAPVPAIALKLLYGDMSEIVTSGQRAVPARALELGYRYEHPDLDEALRSAVGKG
jgi:uncharacterized protein (TIGR01777 family)